MYTANSITSVTGCYECDG